MRKLLIGCLSPADQILSSSRKLPSAELAAQAGIGIRQFQRELSTRFGACPKPFSRILRFQNALDTKARSSVKSWTDVAHELGYFDQMHVVHDFREFTGESPTEQLHQLELIFRAARQDRYSLVLLRSARPAHSWHTLFDGSPDPGPRRRSDSRGREGVLLRLSSSQTPFCTVSNGVQSESGKQTLNRADLEGLTHVRVTASERPPCVKSGFDGGIYTQFESI